MLDNEGVWLPEKKRGGGVQNCRKRTNGVTEDAAKTT